jgi:hypothetical protein
MDGFISHGFSQANVFRLLSDELSRHFDLLQSELDLVTPVHTEETSQTPLSSVAFDHRNQAAAT